MTKNKKKVLAIIAALLFYSCIYINSCTDFDIRAILFHQPLPLKYKTYQELSINSNSSLFEIKKLPHFPMYYDSIQNNIICTNNESETGESSFYKVNADGVIIDSISIKDEIDYEYNYLLNQDFYYDWIISGNPNKHNYLEIDNKDITNREKLDSTLKKYYNLASAIHIYYGFDLKDKNINKYLFLINQQWHVLTVNRSYENPEKPFSYYKDHDDQLQYFEIVDDTLALPNRFTPADYKKNPLIPKVPYYIEYFDKRKHFSAVSGTMNNDHGAFWDGVAYINFIYGKDTLKFKDDNVFLMDKTDWADWAGWVKYERCPRIYVNSRLNFVIINGLMIKHRQNSR